MSNKTLQINFDMEDPLDKTLWEYLKNLPKESRRQFVLQSLLLNVQLPPIYQLCFLQKLLSGISINSNVTPVEVPANSVVDDLLNSSTSLSSDSSETENLGLDRTQFSI